MSDKIIIDKNGNEHGIWVARPGQSVEDGGPYLMSSVADMLKIHAQGARKSTGLRQSEGLWRHEVEVVFPALPFIPLAFMGFKTSDSEPFMFPPNNNRLPVTQYLGTTWGFVGVMPTLGIAHDRLLFKGWNYNYECYFNYTVFLTKIRDKF